MKIFFPVLFITSVVIFSSCKKDDNELPQIEITSPAEGSIFNVLDTVQVSAYITDDKQISSINITLLTSNFVGAASTVLLSGTGKEMNLNSSYMIDDPDLPGGDYYIAIRVYDGEETNTAFRKIVLTEIPFSMENVYVLTKNIGSGVQLHDYNAGALNSIQTLAGDFLDARISTKTDLIYIVGSYTGDLNAVSTVSNAPVWNKPNNALGGAPYFLGMTYHSNNVYVSFYDGTLKGYDASGDQSYLLASPANTYIKKMLVHYDHLFVEQKNYTGTQTKLVLYNLLTTAGLQEISNFNQEVVAFFGKDDEWIYVLANDAGQGHIYLYNTDQNYYDDYNPALPSGEAILAADQINENTLLLCFISGVYRYEYPSGFVPYISGLQAQAITYDAASDDLYLGSGNQLRYYEYEIVNPVLLDSVIAADSIAAVNILYNKE